jgi:hypothetical protein
MEVRNTSRILTTPERIVREHRNHKRPGSISVSGVSPASARTMLLEEAGITKKPSSILERIVKIFFWIVLGWGIGYAHHFLTM